LGTPIKSAGAVGQLKVAQKVELAHQLSRPNGPYAKNQVVRALEVRRATLYWPSKQAQKDRHVLALGFDYYMRASLVTTTLQTLSLAFLNFYVDFQENINFSIRKHCWRL